MAEAINPYQAPQSSVAATDDQAYGDINIFSFKGRLGRLRLFVYTLVLSFIVQIILSTFIGVMFASGGVQSLAVFGIITGIFYLASMIIGAFWAIQRLHDINLSGWWYLVAFVPLLLITGYSVMVQIGAGSAAPEDIMSTGIASGIAGLIVLIFFLAILFIPGTAGRNRFGLQPPPNSTAVKVIAWIFVGLLVLGLLAAILMPALLTNMTQIN